MDILGGCIEALAKDYPRVPIFTEKVKQAKALPCFFVKATESDLAKDLGDYYWLRPKIEVCYYAQVGKANQDLGQMAAGLDLSLHTLGGVKGLKQSQTMDDEILQVSWVYPYRCKLGHAEPGEKMESLAKIKIQLEMGSNLND